MSAEGMPQAESSLLGPSLRWVTWLVTAYPLSTMIVAGLLVAGSMVIAQRQLKFHTNRDDLLSPKSEYHRRWLEYTREFGEQDDVIVVVTGEGRAAIVPVVEEIAGLLAREPRLFHATFYKIDQAKLVGKGLHRAPPETLQGIERFVDQARPVLEGDWAALNVGGRIAWLGRLLEQGDPQHIQAALSAGQAEQERALQILATALSQSGPYRSPWPEMPELAAAQAESSPRYLLNSDERMGMVLLSLAKDEKENFAQYAEPISALRRIVAQVKARHPETWVGVTGLPVMENDEMESSEMTMTQAGVLSFIGVALLYVAGFGCVRHPLLATIALLIPMGWAFGFITLAVGHLNILSSAFGTIVIGLGSDFGVYHIAQYLRLRGQGLLTREALLETARSVGPGITTGALSTALAFFMIGLTDFPGVSELGIIAGGGIVLCWVAAMTVLPAMIQWFDDRRKPWLVPAPLDVYAWLKPLMARPRLLLTGFLLATIVISTGIGRLWYDHNLLNLQPVGLESVELEKRLLQRNKQSASFALSVAKTREELMARKAEFLKLPLVDRVEDVFEYLEGDGSGLTVAAAGGSEPGQRAIVERISRRLAALPEKVPPIPIAPPGELDRGLARLDQVLSAMPAAAAGLPAVRQVRELIRSLPEQEYYRRLSAFQQSLGADLLGRLYALRSVADPEPPNFRDLPEGLVRRLVGRNGCYAMQVYSKADIWDMDAMQQFVAQVRSVDREITGNPIQVYEASRQMKRAYEQAAWYALFTVLIVVYLDFRSIRTTLLALLPLGISMLQMFGLMGLLGIPLNPANMIVLPLILGVGVDNGVHIVHDYLREPAPYRMSGSTAAAIVVNTLMNIVGFGSLMIASHRGLHSLGRVLTIGMACCLLSGLVMPSLLLLVQTAWGRGKASSKDQPSSGGADDSAAPVLTEDAAPDIVPIRRHVEEAA